MAKVMKSVDVVIVGLGWSGSIMARELTKAGLNVVALERGAERTPAEDFVFPYIRDELKVRVRNGLMLDTATETLTMRNAPGDTAPPMRRWDVFSLGDNVGGAGSQFIGNVVFSSVGVSNNIPFAAAFAAVPLAIMAIYLVVARRLGAFEAL